MNFYITFGVISAFAAYVTGIGVNQQYLERSKNAKFLTLMLSVAYISILWPVLWIKVGMASISGVSVDDFKDFYQYLSATNQDWNSVAELRDLARKFYITKQEPVLETDNDLWGINDRATE